ncbi:MAG: SDR family oxidoreductase [Clostridiales bacterium]|nr:SDR family oxidoreductase [Clostridiales bacterium]
MGEGTAVLFAKEGAAVAIAGRSEKDGKRVVDEITRRGGKAMFIKCDVTKAEDISKR